MADTHSNDTLTLLVKKADPQLSVKDEVAVYNATVLYLFRGLNYKTYGTRLKKLSGGAVNVRAITDALSQSGEVIKVLKVWLFYVVKHKLNYERSLELATKWGVDERDVLAFTTISRTALAHMRRLAAKFAALTLEKLDANLARIIQETAVWRGKFVSRKLRFVIQSQGMHRHDIESELIYKGIQGLMMMYPCVETYLHAVNVVKRVVHNQGINMIHHYTTQKMGRLTQDSAGAFHSKVVSLDEAQLNLLAAPETSSDLRIEVHRLIERYQGKRRKFVELLCGAYCPEFTAWLIKLGYKLETNEELMDRVKSDDYMKLALRWLEVSVEAGKKFLEKLRVQFSAYNVQCAIP